jgi:hypothetical protein
MLPALEAEGVKCWVYGGVGIAGAVGTEFYRKNGDVDIYVENGAFGTARDVLSREGDRRGWILKIHKPLSNGRPKFEVLADRDELLSLVPVYVVGDDVEFRTPPVVRRPKSAFLTQESRAVGRYRFTSPPRETVKAIFLSLLEQRPELLERDERRIADADRLLSQQEQSAIRARGRRTR